MGANAETSGAEVLLITQNAVNVRVPFVCHEGAIAVRGGAAEGDIGIKPGW